MSDFQHAASMNGTNVATRVSEAMTSSKAVGPSTKITLIQTPPTRNFSKAKTKDSSSRDASAPPQSTESSPPSDSLQIPFHPPFARTRSMPVPTQLGSLGHPHRLYTSSTTGHGHGWYSVPNTSDQTPFQELSLELADSVQCIVQTILQVSPSQLLDSAKEQYSACSLSIPTPSLSAVLTSMKHLNYMAANIQSFCREESHSNDPMNLDAPSLGPSHVERTDFDIGEILQCTADALGGSAAQGGVDLVLFHADVGIRHVWVRGDESGLSYALAHIVRQILLCCASGDSVELGLHLTPAQQESGATNDTLLHCKVSLFHRYLGSARSPSTSLQQESRPEPHIDSLILRRLLKQIGATLESDLPPPKAVNSEGRTFELSFQIEKAPPILQSPTMSQDIIGSPEPSLDELTAFTETLRGKKVALYATMDGSFARHLSSYLTSWGLDVSHISEGDLCPSPSPTAEGSPPDPLPHVATNHSTPGTNGERQRFSKQAVHLAIIDDDVEVLKDCLQTLHQEGKNSSDSVKKARPSLAANHRAKSSPLITRTTESSLPPPTIVHFTSLNNFKIVKDLIESCCAPYIQNNVPIPQVMVLTKPAGPRRFLTALHTALKKPQFDPLFLPIATSPGTPHLIARNSYVGSMNQDNESNASGPRTSPTAHRPSGSRNSSDRFTKSPGPSSNPGTPGAAPPPSPLANSENTEYFTRKTLDVKQLGASPSSGMMLESPDGQKSIFFQPRPKPSPQSSGRVAAGRGNSMPPIASSDTSVGIKRANAPVARSSSSLGMEVVATSPTDILAANPIPLLPTPLLSQPVTPSVQEVVSPGDEVTPKKAVSPPRSPRESTLRRQVSRKPSGNDATKNSSQNGDLDIVPPINVLIVEDNPINRTILSTFMKKRKIQYDVAVNGQEAVDKWSTGAFHLVLMDIQMPVMDGIEATRQIRRLEKANSAVGFPLGTPPIEMKFDAKDYPSPFGTRGSPKATGTGSPYRSSVIIVALTASNSQSDRDNALAAGCNDFLTKPVSLIWLNNKIIEWGSIKALQMWADLRPPNTIMAAQKAAKVAEKLHIGKAMNRGAGSLAHQKPVRSSSQSSSIEKPSPSTVVDVPVPNSKTPTPSSVGHTEDDATVQASPSGEVITVQQPPTLPEVESSSRVWTQDVANDLEEALGSYYQANTEGGGDASISNSLHDSEPTLPPPTVQLSIGTEQSSMEEPLTDPNPPGTNDIRHDMNVPPTQKQETNGRTQ